MPEDSKQNAKPISKPVAKRSLRYERTMEYLTDIEGSIKDQIANEVNPIVHIELRANLSLLQKIEDDLDSNYFKE